MLFSDEDRPNPGPHAPDVVTHAPDGLAATGEACKEYHKNGKG